MMILNGVQGREINRANTLSSFFTDNEDIYNLLNPFSKEVKLFFGNTKKINALIPIKNENGEGLTAGKNELKASVASDVNTICSLGMAYAVFIGNKDLQNSINYSAADVIKMKDSEILGFVNGLINIFTPLMSDPEFQGYAITQDMLDALSDDATAFNNSLGKAAIVDANSSIAGKNINDALKAIRGNIAQFDRMIHFFKKDNPDFVDGYQKSATINDSGIRHNTVEGVIVSKATGAPIEGALVKGTNKKKVAKSNDKGAYRLDGILSGDRTLEVSAPGYSSQALDVKIARGKAIKVNIAL